MCTVSFLVRKNGYALAMNRDEKLSRIPGLPPSKKIIHGRTVVSPSEPGGGSWVALNDSGVAFALINWYSICTQASNKTVSRGVVVNTISTAVTPKLAAVALARLPLKQVNPFRLIGFFPATHEIIGWHWDLKKLVRKNHPWQTQQWISSGFDEPAAQRIRRETFRHALKQKSAGSLGWLRRLHRSHTPAAGPFSICMHRADAATVSYTEIAMASRTATMRHFDGAPCDCGDRTMHAISPVSI
ncbi:MAG: NRDE family protein [Verrucomicrobiae bacterium]|nr:NRDE family protein [Verrucomicrobiae bacterium]